MAIKRGGTSWVVWAGHCCWVEQPPTAQNRAWVVRPRHVVRLCPVLGWSSRRQRTKALRAIRAAQCLMANWVLAGCRRLRRIQRQAAAEGQRVLDGDMALPGDLSGAAMLDSSDSDGDLAEGGAALPRLQARPAGSDGAALSAALLLASDDSSSSGGGISPAASSRLGIAAAATDVFAGARLSGVGQASGSGPLIPAHRGSLGGAANATARPSSSRLSSSAAGQRPSSGLAGGGSSQGRQGPSYSGAAADVLVVDNDF